MNDQTDQQLLRDYLERQSEVAFAAIVHRYVDLVYSAAVRLSCDAQSARDVTQGVFVALAQNARQLTDRPALAGWLHGTARNLAVKIIRSDARRRAREQEAAVMNELLSTQPDADWEHIAPHLDDALGELSESDRDAVLLRYFKNQDLRTVGATLGISDDAAQKRVSRAVERLRDFLVARGVTIGAGGLAVVISANAVQAAPVGLALTISTAAGLTGTTLATSATVTATKAIAMTALQKTLVTATIAVLAGTGIYEAKQASKLGQQVWSLQQQLVPMTEQIQQLQTSYEDSTNRLAGLIDDNSRLNINSEHNELLKLRDEVTLLRAGKAAAGGETTDSMDSAAKDLLAKVADLKVQFDKFPDKKIPEMQFLVPQDWFEVALRPGYSNSIQILSTLNSLRSKAKGNFAIMMADALSDYSQSNGGRLPSDLSELKPYFASLVDDAVLLRYRLLQTADSGEILPQSDLVEERAMVDEKFDSLFRIGLHHYTVKNFIGNGVRGGNSGEYTIGIMPRSVRLQ